MEVQAFICPNCNVITLVKIEPDHSLIIECPNCSCKIRDSTWVELQS